MEFLENTIKNFEIVFGEGKDTFYLCYNPDLDEFWYEVK